MRTVNTQGGLRKQSECGLWGPAAQVQTLIYSATHWPWDLGQGAQSWGPGSLI